MTHKSPQQATLDAAGWLARLRAEDVTVAEVAAFGDWLCGAPDNVREYLEALAIWERLGAINPDIDIDALLAKTNVVPLIDDIPPNDDKPRQPRGRRRLASMATALAAALITGGAWWALQNVEEGPQLVKLGAAQ